MLVWLGSLLIGVTLGLLGSGGSAITLPVLVYMVGHDAKQSIAESMAIVGLISLAAMIPYARAHQIDWRSVLWFGVPGTLGTFIGASLGSVANEAIQLVVFGVVLLVAAAAMFRNPQPSNAEPPAADDAEAASGSKPSAIWKVALEGLFVGMVTGFVGVGGGFLIVPALVVLGGLPMRLAIGTSLVIIFVKAAVGFVKYEQYLLAHNTSVDVTTVATFVVIGIAGSILGKSLNARLSPALLRRSFAVFLVLIGAFVIVNEGRKLVTPPSQASHSVPAPSTSASDRLTSVFRAPMTTASRTTPATPADRSASSSCLQLCSRAVVERASRPWSANDRRFYPIPSA